MPVGSLGSLRESNRRRVVEALVHAGSASRSDLARLTGLSRTTVATVVADLQERGLVREGQDEQASGRGRPPVMLSLDASAGAVIGIGFGHRHVRVAVADLASRVLAEEAVEFDVDHDGVGALDPATPVSITLGCTRDCLFLVTLDDGSNRPVVAKRGALRGGFPPAQVTLPQAKLKSGAYRVDVRLVNQVNPGPVTQQLSPPLAAG